MIKMNKLSNTVGAKNHSSGTDIESELKNDNQKPSLPLLYIQLNQKALFSRQASTGDSSNQFYNDLKKTFVIIAPESITTSSFLNEFYEDLEKTFVILTRN